MPFAGPALWLLLSAAPCAFAAEPDGLDRVVLNGVLGAAAATAPGRQEAWPGFDLLAQPVLLYRDSGLSFLIGHPAPPPEFGPYPQAAFPQFKVYLSTVPRADIASVFYTGYPLGGRAVFALSYGPGDDAREIINTAVHERFHAWQDGRDGGPAGFKDLPYGGGLYPADIKPENLALAGMEAALLARALRGGPGGLAAVKDFISVRELRRELFGKNWALLDDGLERSEGTAEYAAGLVEKALYADEAVFNAAKLSAALLEGTTGEEAAEHMLHWRQYDTGAAICLLLERRRLPGWRGRVAGGESPFEVLRSLAPLTAAERRARIKAVKKSLGYEARLAAARDLLAEALGGMERAREHFTSYSGPRLLLRAPRPGDTRVSYQSGANYRLDERTELFPEVTIYEFANGYARLLVKEAALQVYGEKDGRESLQVLLSSAPAVLAGGKPAALTATPAEFSEVSIEAPGVTLTAPRALLKRDGPLTGVDIPWPPDGR